MLDLAVIIVNYNTRDLTLDCLRSLFAFKPKLQFKVVLVDNGSVDDSVKAIQAEFPQVKVMAIGENLGFARGNNRGIEAVEAKFYLLLNSDTILIENSLDTLVKVAQDNSFDLLSCQLLNPDKSYQPSGGALPTPLTTLLWLSGLDDLLVQLGQKFKPYHQPKKYQDLEEVGWVGGTVMLIDKKVIDQIGPLDRHIFMYVEDVEFCWRAKRAGFKIGWTSQTSVIHLGGRSSKSPHLAQWRGEFRNLIYLYQKIYGSFLASILKTMIYLFSFLRILGFAIKGRFDYSVTYAKVLISL